MTTTSRDLLARGYTPDEIARETRRGGLVRLRRGAFLLPDEVAADPVEHHRLLIGATVPLLAPGAVLSHRSAAVLHGLPVWQDALDHVEVTRTSGSGNRRGHVHVHVAPLGAGEVVEVAGVTVTSPARTVVDLGRSVPLAQAVAAGDAALRSGCRPGSWRRSWSWLPAVGASALPAVRSPCSTRGARARASPPAASSWSTWGWLRPTCSTTSRTRRAVWWAAPTSPGSSSARSGSSTAG